MMASSYGARQRRRRLFTLLILAITVAIVAAVASSYRNSKQSKRLAINSYLDDVNAVIETSSRQGADLNDLRQKSATLSAGPLESRLLQISKDAKHSFDDMRGQHVPKNATTAHFYLLASFAARAQAAEAMRTALVEAVETDSNKDAASALHNAGEEMVTSDRVYALFKNAVPQPYSKGIPDSKWVDDDQSWNESETSAFITSLRSAKSFSSIHDVSVLFVATDPEPVGTDSPTGALVLPQARAISAKIVVANVGNRAEKQVKVTATLKAASGATDSLRDFIDLAPGQRKAFTLTPLHPTLGEMSKLTVTIDTIDGETNATDNERSIDLIFR